MLMKHFFIYNSYQTRPRHVYRSVRTLSLPYNYAQGCCCVKFLRATADYFRFAFVYCYVHYGQRKLRFYRILMKLESDLLRKSDQCKSVCRFARRAVYCCFFNKFLTFLEIRYHLVSELTIRVQAFKFFQVSSLWCPSEEPIFPCKF